MNRVPLTSDPGINTVSAVKTMFIVQSTDLPTKAPVGAADTGFSPVVALVAGTALCALGATAVVIAAGSAPISGPLAAAGGAAMGFGVSKLPS